ncbi:MAG: heparinase II/III family protein, partial [Planctomycetes bacterium]|nr:heparinase II/III family protein [Planctomycetota bacterium]
HLGHGHHHGGAFTLACRGEPILIDPGRATYAGAGETLAAAHNGIAIDGLGDHPAGLGMRFPADYSRVAAEVVRERRGARVALPGFARLRGVEAVSRTLVAEPGRFAWWDDVECARPVRLSSRLTLAPSVRAEKIGGGIFRLRAAGHVGLVLRTPDPFAAEAEIVGASWSPRYGVTAPTTAIACAARFAGGRLEWSLLPEAGSSPGAGA